MSTRSIKLNDIIKRSSCINSVSESKDTDRLYNILENSIENNTYIRSDNIRSYIENMCNTDNATAHYYEPLELIEGFNENNPSISSYIMKEYTTRIIPYIKELDLVKESVLNHQGVTENQVEEILESVSINNAADRILGNHNTFCKRFNIENEVKRYNTIGLKYVVDSCYDLIDTYKAKNYQKFNIVIEEVSYLLEKNGYSYNRRDVAKHALQHYMSSNLSMTTTDKENFSRAIRESYILEAEDQESICALINMGAMSENISIQNTVNYYLSCSEKSADNLHRAISEVLIHTSKDDIVNNIDKLIYLVWDLYKNNIFENNSELCGCIGIIGEYINSCTNAAESDVNNKEFSKEDIEQMIGTLINTANNIRNIGDCNSNYSMEASVFVNTCIDPLISRLKEINHLLYPKANLEAIEFVNSSIYEPIALNEYKVFKFHNLIRGAFNFDKFLQAKEKKLYNNIKSKYQNFIKKGKNILFGESGLIEENFYSYIGEDKRADICIRQYAFDESSSENISEFLSEVCKEYNDVLDSQNLYSMRSYYIINPGLAEVRIKEATEIDIEESDMEEIRNHIDPAFMEYMDIIKESDILCSIYESINSYDLIDDIFNLSDTPNFTREHFDLALECMSYLDIDNDTVKIFGQRLSDYNFSHALNSGSVNESYIKLASSDKYIEEAIENRTIVSNVPIEIQLEAYGLLLDIFAEAGKPLVGGKAVEARKDKSHDEDDYDDWDADDYDDNEEKDSSKKSPNQKKDPGKVVKGMDAYKQQGTSKISRALNNVKLSLKGISTKMKDLSTKERELSRNMDNAANAFLKSGRDLLTNNRREAIIKGSVVPSFSRCIAAAIAFAGVSYVSPALAIIGAMGAIATSKKLNKQERLLLLDEIETELEVVDKELSFAESNNEMKKYRALLQYKKSLQRQYQRIRYNIRVGKDIIPHSADDGMRSRN